MPFILRLTGLIASAAAAAWQFASGSTLGGAFFAVLTVFALVSVVPRSRSVSRRWSARFGTPNVGTASRTGTFAVLALGLGLTQITGYGLHRDVSRGVLALVASIFFLIVTVDVLFFRDRRRESERFERQAQDKWLQRIAPRVPPESR
jgi:uncharacterized membrane protein